MTTFVGKDGVVKSGANAVGQVRGWSVEESAETLDDTTMGATWRSKKSSLKAWSGSCDALFDDGDSNGQATFVIGAEITVHFQMEGDTSGDHDLTGSAIITGRNITQQYDGLTEISFTHEGNGALSETTVA